MRYMRLIVSVCVMALMSCDSHTDSTFVEIDLCNNTDEFAMMDFVEPIGFVTLEETDSCLLKEINKVIATSDAYYVLDKATQEVSKFGKDGSYICKIGKRGQGPGEYAQISDMDVSKDGQIIYLCSPNSGVLSYNTSDGKLNHQYQIDTDIPLSAIQISDEEILMTADDVPHDLERLYALDNDFKIADSFLPRGKGLSSTLCPQIKKSGDKVYFLDWYNNELYRYNPGKHDVENFVHFSLANDMKSHGIDDFMWLMSRQHEIGFIMDWCISEAYLVVHSLCNGKSKILVYDYKTNKVIYNGNYIGMFLDLNTSEDDKYFVSAITYDNYDYYKDNIPDGMELPSLENGKTNAILMLWQIKPQ